MHKRTRTTLALFMLLCTGLSCARGQHAEPRKANAVEGRAKILIATRQSEFKQEIVNKLVDNYRHKTTLTIIDLAKIGDVRAADYDAMVMMGARMGWLMFSAKERRFLRHLKAPDKLVLLMTAAISGWEWDRDDIDVITCASKPENVAPIYREVSQRLDAILGE